jgi:hypothetical protein
MVSDPILAVGLVMVVRFIRGSAAAAIQLPRITGDNETPQIGEIIFNALLASTALNMLFRLLWRNTRCPNFANDKMLIKFRS